MADCAGGLAALAALAFGAVCGICHGVGQKEDFRANVWKRPPAGGGSGRRIYIPELDRHFSEDQLNVIFAARGGRPRFGSRQLDDLSVVPDVRRAEHFLLRHVEPAVRSARLGARLKIADDDTRRLVDDARKRLVRFRDALDDLHSQDGIATRSLPLYFAEAEELLPRYWGADYGQRGFQDVGRFENARWSEGHGRSQYRSSVASHGVTVDIGQSISTPKNPARNLGPPLSRGSARRVLLAG